MCAKALSMPLRHDHNVNNNGGASCRRKGFCLLSLQCLHFLNLCEPVHSHYECTQCVHIHLHCDCTFFTAVVNIGHNYKSCPSLCQAQSCKGVQYAHIPVLLACEAESAEKLYPVHVMNCVFFLNSVLHLHGNVVFYFFFFLWHWLFFRFLKDVSCLETGTVPPLFIFPWSMSYVLEARCLYGKAWS